MSKKHKRFKEEWDFVPLFNDFAMKESFSLGRIYTAGDWAVNINDMIRLLENIQKRFGNLPVYTQLELLEDEVIPVKTLQVEKMPKYGYEPRQADAIILSRPKIDEPHEYGQIIWDDTWIGMDVGKCPDQTGKIDIFGKTIGGTEK